MKNETTLTGNFAQNRQVIEKTKVLNMQKDAVREHLSAIELNDSLRPREKRILIEDTLLENDPQQKKLEVLDYIRRERVFDNVHVMPEIIKSVYHLLNSSLIDFEKDNISPQDIIDKIINLSQKIESGVMQKDSQIHNFLETNDVSNESDFYLSQDWFENKLLFNLEYYKKTLEKPIHPKNPLANDPEKYKIKLREKVTKQLQEKGLIGDIDSLLDSYEKNTELFNLSQNDESKEIDDIEKFMIDHIKQCCDFYKYPKIEEYDGEIIEMPPSLKNQRLRSGVKMIERDAVPDIKGGVIIDGNFGYDEDGNTIRPSDKMIIDHHDEFDDKIYDTATIMVNRHWLNTASNTVLQMKEKRRYGSFEKFEDERGKIVTMVNHVDTDSILSLWSFRNPYTAEKYKGEINKISKAADFLLGSNVLKYGVTSREYEYIIRNYFISCWDTIKQERTDELENELDQKKSTYAESDIKEKLVDIQEEIEEIKKAEPEIISIMDDINTLKKNPELSNKEKGLAIREKTNQLKAVLQQHIGEKIKKQQELQNKITAIEKDIRDTKTIISQTQTKKITVEENEVVLNHMLDNIEDIIQNPFKYQKFLQNEQKKEIATVDQIGADYRNGKIEIANDNKDPDIITISPGSEKTIPSYDPMEGLYLFLKNRADFNKQIITTLDKNTYTVAINARDMFELKEYNFNNLINELKEKEDSVIDMKIAQTETEIGTEENDKKKQKLTKKITELKNDKKLNQRGQLWRNRTQMVFCFKTHLHQNEFLDLVRIWKKAENQKEKNLGTGKRVSI